MIRRISLTIFILVYGIGHALSQSSTPPTSPETLQVDSIYVLTNRKVDTSYSHLTYCTQMDEAKALSYVKVKHNANGEWVNEALSRDEFVHQVSGSESDWLLFVHGDSKTYDQSIQRGIDIQSEYNVNVIVFSWPSKEPDLTGLKNLNNSKRNVQKSMGHFDQVLACIHDIKTQTIAPQANLSMMLHSLGNLYLEKMIREPSVVGEYPDLFENVILNSAAVDQKMHHEWVEQIDLQQRIYITSNKSDFNLKGKHIFSKDKNQLGEKAKEPCAQNACYIDFSKSVGFRFPTGTTHTYFIGNMPNECKSIHTFYFDVFHGYPIDLNDTTHFKKRKKGVVYEIVY